MTSSPTVQLIGGPYDGAAVRPLGSPRIWTTTDPVTAAHHLTPDERTLGRTLASVRAALPGIPILVALAGVYLRYPRDQQRAYFLDLVGPGTSEERHCYRRLAAFTHAWYSAAIELRTDHHKALLFDARDIARSWPQDPVIAAMVTEYVTCLRLLD